MTRVVVIGAGTGDVAAALAELGLATVATLTQYRELVESMAMMTIAPAPIALPAPKFGSDRPYLKKKKGRS